MNDDREMETHVVEIGSVCPPIKSWFFPSDGSEPYQLESKEKEDGDSPQSS